MESADRSRRTGHFLPAAACHLAMGRTGVAGHDLPSRRDTPFRDEKKVLDCLPQPSLSLALLGLQFFPNWNRGLDLVYSPGGRDAAAGHCDVRGKLS